MKEEPKVTVIRYSCVNGKAVWIYQGKSHLAARIKYWRSCKHELTLQRKWPRLMEKRRQNIQHLLDECMSAMPMMGDMTDRQRKAIRTLQSIANNPPVFYTGFYNHICTSRRRKAHDSDIRRKMREKDERDVNRDYGK